VSTLRTTLARIAISLSGLLISGCAAAVPVSPTVQPTIVPEVPLVDAALPGLMVDADISYGPISPYVYGTAYGPWIVVPFDLRDEASDAGLTWLRFPGGNWGDNNNITERQLDQYIELAQMMNAETSVSVRVKNGTPEQAAQLVRYANIDKDYNIRYWIIGNEPNLYDRENYGTQHFNADWRSFAEAMRAVDPTIVLMGPEVSQYPGIAADNPKDFAGNDWMREFLTANGDMVDIVTIHRYPFPASNMAPPATLDELRASAPEWERIIPYLRSEIKEVTGRDITIAVTETNSHWRNVNGGKATPDSHFHAVWWADVLGRLIRQRVHMVNYFLLQSSGSVGTYGLLSNLDVRPTYYVYKMYEKFGTELVYAGTSTDEVTIYAARRDDGPLTVMVINLSDEEQQKPLTIAGFDPSGAAEVWRFDADHTAERVDDFDIADGTQLSLPPQSISLYVIP
jgi:alpha-L-arabinofuranosidase